MLTKKVVFAQTLESLFGRALGRRLPAETKARLRVLGIDLDKPWEATYPFGAWMEAVDVTARALHPDKGPVEARYLLGRAVTLGYAETMTGRALMRFLKLMGPTLTLRNATNSFKTGNNFTETRLTELGPGRADLWMNDVGGYPEFTAGIIAAGVEVAGAKDVRVAFDHHVPAATYHVSWRA